MGGLSIRDKNYTELGGLARFDEVGRIVFPSSSAQYFGTVSCFDSDVSGRLILAGSFELSGSPRRRGFVRMNGDGSIVPAGGIPIAFSASGPALLAQNDGKVLVSGNLSSTTARLIRVGADDAVDSSFRAPDLSSALSSMMVFDDDGRLLMTNASASRGGQVGSNLVMLKPDTLPSLVPTITTQPADAVVANGTSAHLWVAAAVECGGLAYQWYEGAAGDTSVPIAGAALPVYDTSALTAATQFWVRVSNGTTSVDSRTVTIAVDPRQTFAQWIGASGAPADQRGELDTPAGDGIANLLKFLLGVPALDAVGTHFPVPELYSASGKPASVALVFARNTNALGIRYALEVSSDLTNWAEVESTEDLLGTNPDGTALVRLRELSPPDVVRRFIRLKLELASSQE